MLRFTMPDPMLPLQEQKNALKDQFDGFLRSDALEELFSLLHVDRQTFSKVYNGRRTGQGTVRETQEIERNTFLDECRAELYPLLDELGFMGINRPLCSENSRILVLGGSFDACYARTQYAARWVGPSTRFVDGLACYRPINPAEREGSIFSSSCETEFGAMRDSFADVFHLSPSSGKEEFRGNRNLNGISCVKTFGDSDDGRVCRIFAAPSTQPELRRADTGDSLLFYLREAALSPGDRLLAITHNRHVSRQFVQLAYQLMREEQPFRMDVIGCVPDERIVSAERYDPYQFLQDLIGLLDWIERFMREL